MDAELYAELTELQNTICAFPAKAHWFCPRIDDDDFVNYQDDDSEDDEVSKTVKQQRINDSVSRQQQAYQFIRVYGLPSDDQQAITWREWYSGNIDKFLTTCDKCVKHYHMGRQAFLIQLATQYDEDTVQQMAEIIDGYDCTRIENGLKRAKEILLNLPRERRTLSGLAREDGTALQAVHEAVCCKAFLNFTVTSPITFDTVFHLIQTNKTLVLAELVPATTKFLFATDEYRSQFAVKGWTGDRTNQKLTRELFAWAVQDLLADAMRWVNMPDVSVAGVERFWTGVLLILEHLDEELITHSLRALDVVPDIYHLAFNFLSYDSPDILALVIRTMHLLLRRSAKSFWDACGSISGSAITEAIFSSVAFKPLLTRHLGTDSSSTDSCPALMWLSPLLRSLGPNQQYETCRTMLSFLLVNLQADEKLRAQRFACCRAALEALMTTLTTFTSEDYRIIPSTSFITINNVLHLVDQFKEIIIQCATVKADDSVSRALAALGLDVIRSTIYLDCRALKAQYMAIVKSQDVHHDGQQSRSEDLWQAILAAFKPDNMAMAAEILAGIEPLNSVDHYRQWKKDARRNPLPLSKAEERFEQDFAPMTAMVTRIYERLGEFKPENLRKLCQNPQTSAQMFAGLVPADRSTYDMAVDIIKTVTGEDTRKGAISKLLRESLEVTLSAMSKAVSSATTLKTYAAFPHLVKTGRDTLDSLCDARDGLLRIRPSLSSREQLATKTWWKTQWRTLEIAFKTTESWSQSISTTSMTGFVRDTMDFAEVLFDNYSILASALEGSISPSHSSGREIRRALLEQPRKTMNEITKWLKLRDPYLVEVSTSLVCKLLRRLAEFDGMEIERGAQDFIEMILQHEIRTVLTGQQKAELRRAFNEHCGIQEIDVSAPVQSKPVVRVNLEAWRNHTTSAQTPSKSMNLTQTLDTNQSVLAQMRARQKPAQPTATKVLNSISIKESREKERKARIARNAATIAAAKALRGESALIAGEGSALTGLGLAGKDHTPQRGEIMVSSESETDSEIDDDSTMIIPRKSGAKKGLVRLASSAQEGPVKKKRIVRTVKDMRARLTPPMDPLYMQILDWEVFDESAEPPGQHLQEIANRFRTPMDYNATFFPMLLSEAWHSFRRDMAENQARPFEVRVSSRMSVDRFYEVSTLVATGHAKKESLREGDIVVLSKSQSPMDERQAPHCLARIKSWAYRGSDIEITYQVNQRMSDSEGGVLSHLAPKSTLHGLKITSLTTIEREYAALYSLQYFDLCEEVISAKPSPLLRYSQSQIDRQITNYGVNSGQAKAILSAVDNDGFTLIQGPPGTGKTKTIVAMVGALLSSWSKEVGVAITRPGSANPKPLHSKAVSKKLLICAPSNAAVDEVAKRLKAGVITLSGERRDIKVVRMGNSDKVSPDTKELCLEDQVQARLAVTNKGAPVLGTREALHQTAAKIKSELAVLTERRDAAREGPDQMLADQLAREWRMKKDEQTVIGRKIDENKDNGMTKEREKSLATTKAQQDILDEADVLCSTLSGSGHDMFKKLNIEFETVIIDEAAQCVELSSLIPLKYGCSKCILVGDPEQLPPTVIAQYAGKLGYNRSLFLRMQQNYPNDVHLLDTQYRMHPEISLFPSRAFYHSRLIDGENMAELRIQPWHARPLFGPFRWFDIRNEQVMSRGGKLINHAEIDAALQIYDRLKLDYPTIDFRNKIGIITPYRAQLAEIKSRFSQKYGDDIFEHIDMNTADSFQGREADIIIFSCVRSSGKGIGFLDDVRRMNVALTRAKSSLWVLGNSQTLQQDDIWASFVKSAKDRNLFTDGDVAERLRAPLPKGSAMRALPIKKHAADSVLKDVSGHSVSSELTTGNLAQPPANHEYSHRDLKPVARSPAVASPMERSALSRDVLVNAKSKTAVDSTLDNGTSASGTAEQSAVQSRPEHLTGVDADKVNAAQPLRSNAEKKKRSTATPLNSALRAHAPKVIKKKPSAADPLRRGR